MASRLQPSAPRSAYAAWGAVCIIWGTTYLGIRIALETIPPGLLGGMRFTVAGTVLCLFVVARGDRLPPLRAWPMQALIGVLMLGVGNGFIVVAEQWIPSGIAAVSVASSPFWMTGIDALTGGERLTLRGVVGFVLGFAGIVVLMSPDLHTGGGTSGHFVLGMILGQLACLGWSIGSSMSKRTLLRQGSGGQAPARQGSGGQAHTRQGSGGQALARQDEGQAPARRGDDGQAGWSALGASAVQQLSGGLATLAVGLAAGEWPHLSFSTRSFTAEIYLIVLGSLGAYSAYIYALQYLPISTVSLYAYVNPVIAVILGTLIVSEPLSPRVVAAGLMVLAGIAVVRSAKVEVRAAK
jgi:drug/metabolite transporter (DMT)-like permease